MIDFNTVPVVQHGPSTVPEPVEGQSMQFQRSVLVIRSYMLKMYNDDELSRFFFIFAT